MIGLWNCMMKLTPPAPEWLYELNASCVLELNFVAVTVMFFASTMATGISGKEPLLAAERSPLDHCPLTVSDIMVSLYWRRLVSHHGRSIFITLTSKETFTFSLSSTL